MSSISFNDPTRPVSVDSGVRKAPKPKAESSTYGQILKSTALVGGSSVANVLIGIVRTKAMAMLLGPAGFGLAGLYMSIASLTQSVAGLGVNSSGVRQIAEAAGSNDTARIAQTAAVLRRTSVVLGVFGAILLIALAKPVSVMTFGGAQQTSAICLLSLAVLFNLVSTGQGAVIQGLRRISDLAQMSVLGSLFGTIATIIIVYFLRQQGIVPALVAVAAVTLLTSWWYSRKIVIPVAPVHVSELKKEMGALLKLGLAFMTSGLLMLGSAYVVRILVLRKLGLEATGFYQAAWTLGGLYVGVILQAMGADFYPRLTASANDNQECNRLVNEQARVSLLLAGPGVLGTLTFAPLIIALFYTANFGAAVGILRWICLGIALRVISWPMGFIVMAKGNQMLFLLSELSWTTVHLGLAWICVGWFGLDGAGIAFFGSYAFHILMTYGIVRHVSGFTWSSENRQTCSLYLALIGVVFGASILLPRPVAFGLGTLLTLLSGIYSIRVLVTLVSPDRIPVAIRHMLIFFRLSPSPSF